MEWISRIRDRTEKSEVKKCQEVSVSANLGQAKLNSFGRCKGS